MYPVSLLAAAPLLGGVAGHQHSKTPVSGVLSGIIGGTAGGLAGAVGGEILQLLLEALLYRASRRPSLVREISKLTRENLPIAATLLGGYGGGALMTRKVDMLYGKAEDIYNKVDTIRNRLIPASPPENPRVTTATTMYGPLP
jgi:hypothetical protein